MSGLSEKELEFLKELNTWCRQNFDHVWSIPFEEGEFLHWLLRAQKSKSILEIGGSYGMSTCWLGLAARENKGKVTSLEFRQEAVEAARKNLSQLGLEKTVEVIQGDAFEILKTFAKEKKEFDFVFLDSHKGDYIKQFELFYSMLSKGAVVVADNINTHVKGTKPYVEFVQNNPKLLSVTNPIGNGVELTIKLE
ncbi:MAG: class I SAM-dependent methyltransferase [Candidatus Diapherotrites archaeon]|nr:class I SAM-dependent methyltransferase [Candidatus Diapherotrites archaeon]